MNNSIYINIFNYRNKDFPFQIFTGGRGVGKTYSALSGVVDKKLVPERFIFMRRTGKELEFLLDSDRKGEGLNPFKTYNTNNGTNFGLKAINDNIAGVYAREVGEDGKLLYNNMVGYAAALSGVASVRGIDTSDASIIIYDEFIPERHVKAFAGSKGSGAEFDALMNAYESFNRNRELEGKPPMEMFLLSNANDIYNEIFVGLNIVDDVEKMRREGKTDKYFRSRGLAIHLLPDDTEFTELKSKTALYKLTAGTRFNEMALHNDFAYNDFSLIEYRNITGYVPVCQIDDVTIWRKKGSKEFYACRARAEGLKPYHSEHDQDVKKFLQKYGINLRNHFIESRLYFESFDIKTRLLDIIG